MSGCSLLSKVQPAGNRAQELKSIIENRPTRGEARTEPELSVGEDCVEGNLEARQKRCRQRVPRIPTKLDGAVEPAVALPIDADDISLWIDDPVFGDTSTFVQRTL